MTPQYGELAERIRGEVEVLDSLIRRAERFWRAAHGAAADQDAYLDAVALNLHSVYSGIERLFEMIARHVDRTVPAGEQWHRALLQQMARDLPGLRPAVIDMASEAALEEYRRFRHLVRNLYATTLAPDRMEPLLIRLPGVWRKVRAELLAFADLLAEL